MSEIDGSTKALRWELECLWGDLFWAKREALNGVWSIRCRDLRNRIEDITKIVGPTPWRNVQVTLLELGTYQEIHAEMGVDVDVDMEQVAALRARIDEMAGL